MCGDAKAIGRFDEAADQDKGRRQVFANPARIDVLTGILGDVLRRAHHQRTHAREFGDDAVGQRKFVEIVLGVARKILNGSTAMTCLSSLPQVGGLEEDGRKESDWLDDWLGAALGAWLLRILLKTLPRVPLNRHELRALRGGEEDRADARKLDARILQELSQQGLQFVAHFGHGPEALAGFLGERAVEGDLETRRGAGNLFGDRLRLVVDHGVQNFDPVAAFERLAACDHFIDQDPEAEYIGAVIDALARRLLRRPVPGSPVREAYFS